MSIENPSFENEPEKQEKMSVKRFNEIRKILKANDISVKELLLFEKVLSAKSNLLLEDLKEWYPEDGEKPTNEELDAWEKEGEK